MIELLKGFNLRGHSSILDKNSKSYSILRKIPDIRSKMLIFADFSIKNDDIITATEIF